MGIFTTVLVQPILNLLVWLYDVVPGRDIGVAIILLTFIVKLLLYPFTVAQIKQQRALQELQPKIDEIRARLKDNKEEQAKELMALYGKEKVNPAASCLPLLIQLPVFIALYSALKLALNSQLGLLYPFIPDPQSISPLFMGFIPLNGIGYTNGTFSLAPALLAVLAGAIQFVQTRQILKPPAATVMTPPPDVVNTAEAKDESMATMMNKQMSYIMPIMTIFIGMGLPAGLTLYWLVMSLFTVVQQAITLKRLPPKIEPQL